MTRNIEKLFSFNSQNLPNNSNSIRCGYISDGGSILGSAAHDNISLIFLGATQKPLPNWDKSSPMIRSRKRKRISLYLNNRYMAV